LGQKKPQQRSEQGGPDVIEVCNPEDRQIQQQIPDRASTDSGDDAFPPGTEKIPIGFFYGQPPGEGKQKKAPPFPRLPVAGKLTRFSGILMPAALVFVWGLGLGYGIGRGPGNGWLHAKLALVVLLFGYHHACGAMLRKFRNGVNARSHTFYRWFNEVPVIGLLAIVILVIVKPF